MNWFARRIHRYEQRRWKTDDNRLVRPFAWGWNTSAALPSIPIRGIPARVCAAGRREQPGMYSTTPATDYRLDGENVLTFTSSIESPWPENNTVHAQFFPAAKRGPPCSFFPIGTPSARPARLRRMAAAYRHQRLKMSLPYHDRRMAKGTSVPTSL